MSLTTPFVLLKSQQLVPRASIGSGANTHATHAAVAAAAAAVVALALELAMAWEAAAQAAQQLACV